MKLPGRVYVAKSGEAYLAVYNQHEDIYVGDFNRNGNQPSRVAHIRYSYGGSRRSIDVFRLEDRLLETENVNLKRVVRQGENVTGEVMLDRVDEKQAVTYEFEAKSPFETPTVMQLARTDIGAFCKNPARKKTAREHVVFGPIVPETTIKYIEHSEYGMLTPGKKEFVKRCLLESNLDFGKGCITSWLPGKSGGSFDGKTFMDYWHTPLDECTYCYAEGSHKTFPKTIFRHDSDRLKEELLGAARKRYGSDEVFGKKVNVLRLGKRTETGASFFRDTLASTWEVCAEVGTRIVMPTKMLEFDPEMAKLAKKARVQLLYSMGDLARETGTIAHGCDDDFKIEQAIKYREAGVDASFYLMMHAHAAPTQSDLELIDLGLGAGVKVQLLPERFSSKSELKRATGLDWDKLKIHPKRGGFPGDNLFEELDDDHYGSYILTPGGELVPKMDRMHQDWDDLMNDHPHEIRMCAHDDEILKCGTCFLAKGFEAPFEKPNLKSVDKPGQNARKKKDNGQDFPGFEVD